jgi:hypothetical protein
MLTKYPQTEYVEAIPAVPYRPYSKTCPAASAPSSTYPTQKTVCGTYSIYGFLAYDLNGKLIVVQETVYDIPGYVHFVTFAPTYDTTKPTKQLQQPVQQGPYCATVTVNE